MQITIEKARALGFCFGVRRAIKLIENAAPERQDIATLGPIVHNRLVAARLADMGIRSISSLDEFTGEIIAIASHGVSPEVLARIHDLKIKVIDTTCPNVRSAQKAAKKLAESGFGIVIFGDATHPEVKALVGWSGNNAIATLGGGELNATELPVRLGILSQTTQGKAQFTHFTSGLLERAFPHVQEVRVINTLCDETQKRQAAALELAQKSDLMIVVGGRNSANTQRLADVCQPITETHLIETADEIVEIWLAGKRHIGITAGASTPGEAIEEVVRKLTAKTSGG